MIVGDFKVSMKGIDKGVSQRPVNRNPTTLFLGYLGLLLLSLLLLFAGCGSKPLAISSQDLNSLTIDKPTLVMRTGSSNTLICSQDGKTAENLVWSSRDETIARVDQLGQVIAVSKGTTLIKAATMDGHAYVQAKVIVDRDPLPPLAYIEAARFQLHDGVYVNTESAASGKARLMVTGDLMCLLRQQRQAQTGDIFDFNASFAKVRPILAQGDFVIGNLETMLSHTWPYKIDETSIKGQWNCNAPPTYLDALRYAGFDAVVNANNHSCDSGPQGIYETLDHLNRYQLLHTGLFTAPGQPHYILADVNGIRIAILSYALKFNGLDSALMPEELNTMVGVYSKQRIKADIDQAKAKGAEFVIAYIHWGNQNESTVNSAQRSYALEMANAGVDYIIGSHPHVLQPYDWVRSADGRKVPVLYSMGNFIASSDEVPGNRDAIILQIELEKRAKRVNIVREGYYPCYVMDEIDGVSTVVVPISLTYRGGVMSAKFDQAQQRIVRALGSKISELN